MQLTDTEIAVAARALSEPIRLRILRLLPDEHDCEDMYNVSELAEELGLSQPVVSRHIGMLKRAGLVVGRRVCQGVYYAIDKKRAKAVLTAMNKTLKRTR